MIRIYDTNYRGECRLERYEQIDCISWLRHNHPERSTLFLHIPNESKGSGNHLQMRIKEGVQPGAPDMLDLNGPLLGLFELKRLDSKKSRVSPDQRKILLAGAAAGAFAAICYGFEGFKLAYADFLAICLEHG